MEKQKYKKCKICGKRFEVQDWKIGEERKICFTCGFINGYIKATKMAINELLKRKTKTSIEVSWKYKTK